VRTVDGITMGGCVGDGERDGGGGELLMAAVAATGGVQALCSKRWVVRWRGLDLLDLGPADSGLTEGRSIFNTSDLEITTATATQ
jgi:hypothetical protein